MRSLAILTLVLGAILLLPFSVVTASAGVVAKIDLSEQRMRVYVDSDRKYSWAVSTARRGYRTPTGNFKPTRMYKSYFSRKYHGSPMPHSIFFYGGYAIHGTDAIKSLGSPVSHGCIRLHPSNAAVLFGLVKSHGAANTRITITR